MLYSKEKILERLHQHKVNVIQFDPNGVCNAKCWYCPVRYEAHTPSTNTSIENVETILNRITSEKGKIVSTSLYNFTIAHYNEVVLYPYFEELLKLLNEKDFNFVYMYSNGVAFTKKITDIVLRYENIFKEIQFNIPAIEKEQWSKQTGFTENKFENLIENLNYLNQVISPKLLEVVNVDINAISEKNLFKNGGFITKLENFPDISFEQADDQLHKFKERFPKFKVLINNILYDRDSLLEKNKIFSLRDYMTKISKDKSICGCQLCNKDKIDGEMAGRFFGVMTINNSGDLILCCNDYSERTKFGNIIENSIEEVWFGDKHVEMLYNEINFGMCQTCPWAQWK